MRHARAIVALAIASMLAGCAIAPPAPLVGAPAPAHVHRTIAVVPVSAGAAKTGFAGIDRVDPGDHAKAGAQGLGKGALAGAAAAGNLLPYVLAAGPGGYVAIPFIFAGAAAIGFVGGYLQGASAIGPSPQSAALEAAMSGAATVADIPSAMAAAIADDITRWTPYRAQAFARGAGVEPSASGGWPGSAGFDTVLQFEITQFGYAGRSAGKDVALYMLAEAKLVAADSGQPVALRGLAYVSPWHGTELWTKADGALTRAELKRASRALGERIVEHMLLDTPWRSSPSAATTVRACGVLPISARGTANVLIPGPQVPVKVDSAMPTLAWSAPLPPIGETEDAVATPADDIRYDLRIFEEFDWGPGDLVYERTDLTGNEHKVEAALKPATMYFWAVRARFVVDGHPRATRWSATVEPASLDPLPPQAVYASQPGGNGAMRVACAAPHDLTPCACLDFIPTANWFRFRTP